MASISLAVLASASAFAVPMDASSAHSGNSENPQALDSGQEPAKPFTEADFDANVRQVVERDYFPVLDEPETVTVAGVAKRLSAYDLVIGVVQNGEARAYPVAVMGKHELANDVVGGEPITVSW